LYSIVVPILPAHIIGQQKDFADSPVGSGPFKLVSQSSTDIVLAPNEHYYGAPPQLDRLVFKIVSDDNTRFLKMKKGELDLLINAIPLDKIDEVRKPPLNETYNIIEEPGLSYNYISFNLDNPAVRDVRLRQAIAHAVNIEEIIAYRLDGHAVRATGLLASLNPYYEGNVAAYPYDPDRAKALLDEAGLKDPDGDGPQPRLTLELKTSNNAQATGTARILQAQLAEVGINLDIRSYEWGTFYGDIRSGNFQMTTMRWVGINDPDFYYDVFHSSRTPPQGNNRGRYSNPDVDKMLEAGRITVNFPERKAVYAKVQQKLTEDLPYISLWHANNISLVHKRVKGYRQHPTGGFLSFRDISLE
jgi:peptide/nickel transport system substrate-binding protein